jgi:hypothetical protein
MPIEGTLAIPGLSSGGSADDNAGNSCAPLHALQDVGSHE